MSLEVGRRVRGLGVHNVLGDESACHGFGNGGEIVRKSDESRHPPPGVDEVPAIAEGEAAFESGAIGNVDITAAGLDQFPQNIQWDSPFEMKVQFDFRGSIEGVGHPDGTQRRRVPYRWPGKADDLRWVRQSLQPGVESASPCKRSCPTAVGSAEAGRRGT